MRYTDLEEAAKASVLEITPQNIKMAKSFAYQKWVERAKETGRSIPSDLSGACKACSLFASKIFGGKIVGNEFHQWVEVSGMIVDLAEDAADVAQMKNGEIPDYAQAYAAQWNLNLPENGVYEKDMRFMKSADAKASLASFQPRVEQWIREFWNDHSKNDD